MVKTRAAAETQVTVDREIEDANQEWKMFDKNIYILQINLILSGANESIKYK